MSRSSSTLAATIATMSISETASLDETTGITSVSATITATLMCSDALFFDGGDARTIYTRTPAGVTRINTHYLLKQCTATFDKETPPTIGNDNASLTVTYVMNPTRHVDPARQMFTEGLHETMQRLQHRIEDVYKSSMAD